MRPSVLVTRATFPDIADRLREHFELEDNPEDTIWSPAELMLRLQGKQGAISTDTEPIAAALLDACPMLKAVYNVGVGYNNVDVVACTTRRRSPETVYAPAAIDVFVIVAAGANMPDFGRFEIAQGGLADLAPEKRTP